MPKLKTSKAGKPAVPSKRIHPPPSKNLLSPPGFWMDVWYLWSFRLVNTNPGPTYGEVIFGFQKKFFSKTPPQLSWPMQLDITNLVGITLNSAGIPKLGVFNYTGQNYQNAVNHNEYEEANLNVYGAPSPSQSSIVSMKINMIPDGLIWFDNNSWSALSDELPIPGNGSWQFKNFWTVPMAPTWPPNPYSPTNPPCPQPPPGYEFSQ